MRQHYDTRLVINLYLSIKGFRYSCSNYREGLPSGWGKKGKVGGYTATQKMGSFVAKLPIYKKSH